MSKKYVLIFAKTAHVKTPYDVWLKDSGVEPIIFTSEDFVDGYCDIQFVFEFANYDTNQLIEKKALQLASRFSFVAIFARAEADIIRAAKLRELLNLPGQNIGSALAYRNKIVMKNHLRDSGIKLPQYQIAQDGCEVVKFVESHGYPVVLKPFSASGSFNTFIINNEPQLDLYLQNPPAVEMEIETFIDGKMYHVDGLIVNGEINFIQPFEYVNDCLSFREDKYIGNVTVSPDNPVYQLLIEATVKVISNLPETANMAFHSEFWHTSDNQIYFCEIASRTGGGMIASAIRESLGLDLDKQWLYAECGIPTVIENVPFFPYGCICIPPLKGIFLQKPDPGKNPVIVFEEFSGKINVKYNGGVKSGLFLVGYVINGNSCEEIKRNIHDVAHWFTEYSEWDLVGQKEPKL